MPIRTAENSLGSGWAPSLPPFGAGTQPFVPPDDGIVGYFRGFPQDKTQIFVTRALAAPSLRVSLVAKPMKCRDRQRIEELVATRGGPVELVEFAELAGSFIHPGVRNSVLPSILMISTTFSPASSSQMCISPAPPPKRQFRA